MYGECLALFDIQTLEMIEGDLPSRAKGMVEDWAREHQAELMRMWQEQRFHKLAPLE